MKYKIVLYKSKYDDFNIALVNGYNFMIASHIIKKHKIIEMYEFFIEEYSKILSHIPNMRNYYYRIHERKVKEFNLLYRYTVRVIGN